MCCRQTGFIKWLEYIPLLIMFCCVCVCVHMWVWVCVCWALTELGVIEREVPQVGRVLRQGEEAPRKAVPHEVTPGALPHHPVLDDLGEGQEEERDIQALFGGPQIHPRREELLYGGVGPNTSASNAEGQHYNSLCWLHWIICWKYNFSKSFCLSSRP